MFTQAGLLGCWTALELGNAALRTAAAAGLMIPLMLLAAKASIDAVSVWALLLLLQFILVASAGASLRLWSWRLVHPDLSGVANSRLQFTMRYILGCMLGVAILSTVFRLVELRIGWERAADVVLELSILALVVALHCLTGVWLVFSRIPLPWRATLAVILTPVLSLAPPFVMNENNLPQFQQMGVLQVLLTRGSCLMVRAAGYRLDNNSDPLHDAPSNESSGGV